MSYLRVASGYRPGWSNIVLNDPATGEPLANPTFDSDSLTSYEAGIKISNSDRRYALDAAIYQIDWDDIQIIAAINGVGVTANAASARSRGAELTLTGRPVDALTLVGAFAYTDAELTEDSPDLGADAGDPLPNTPKFTAALSADSNFDVAGHDAGVGATWRYIDDRVSGYARNPYPQFDLGSYDTLDIRGHIDFGSTSAAEKRVRRARLPVCEYSADGGRRTRERVHPAATHLRGRGQCQFLKRCDSVARPWPCSRCSRRSQARRSRSPQTHHRPNRRRFHRLLSRLRLPLLPAYPLMH